VTLFRAIQRLELRIHVKKEYTKGIDAYYGLEDDCNDQYMDSCHLWEDNCFHLLFNDYTPPCVENIIEGNQEPIMVISA
jgi:hypothetical protein